MLNFVRWLLYPLVIVGSNALLWGACNTYLKMAPVIYNSEFTLILPRADSKVDTSITGFGQVASGTNSIYSTELADPRADYKFIIETDSFLSSVAKSLEITTKELGQPRIKLIDNSSILQIEMKGKSPKDAQTKAKSLHDVFFKEINRLRREEENKRDQGYSKTLDTTTNDLKIAQEKLARFQAESGFNSPEQINYLADSIEKIRQMKAEIDAEQRAVSQKLVGLSTNLNVTPKQASQAFTLQSDQLFQITLKEYSDATANLEILTKKWAEKHPEVVKERSRQQVAAESLKKQGELLLGEPINDELLSLLNLNPNNPGGSGRYTLYENIISLNAQEESLSSKSKELEQNLEKFKVLYTEQIKNRETYENLNRDLRIAEALFSSTSAQNTLSDQNVYAAYPLVQTLTKPSLPSEPSSPKKKYALLGTAFGSLLISFAICLLWVRDIQKHKKVKVIPEEEKKPSEDNLNSYPISRLEIESAVPEKKVKASEN